MMGAPPGVPRATWFAVGIGAAAAAALAGWPAVVGIVAGLVAIAAGASALPPGLAGWRPSLVAAGLGAVVLGLRVLALPQAPPGPGLEAAGTGPWTADVVSVGTPKDGGQLVRVALDVDGGTGAGDARVVVAATLPAFPEVSVDTVIEVAGRLAPPSADAYGEYLRRTGAAGSLRASSVRVVRGPPALGLASLRDGAGDALQQALPEPEAGLAAGILVGLRERVDRQLAADFATAGVSHVVAISGWNIAIVAGLVGALLRGRSRRLVAGVVGGVIVAYVVAAGASPSVVRAAVMAGVVLAARETGRAGRAPAALALAVSILLLASPPMIGDAGFRLSVMATGGLLAWATPLGAWLGRIGGGRMPRWLAEGLGITLAAQAATLPDVLATFGRLSLVAPAVNLLVVPLVPAAMAGGVAAMLAGWLVTLGAPAIVGIVVGLPGWLLLHAMVLIVRFAAGLPLAAVVLPEGANIVAAFGAAAATVAALAWIRRRGSRPRRRRSGSRVAVPGVRKPVTGRVAPSIPERIALAAVAVALGTGLLSAADVASRGDRIIVLDVGQGDAILVESRDGARMLVDGGPDPDRLLLELDAVIPPWDRRLDIVVLTHPHEDHVAGLVRALERYRVGRVFEPGMPGTGPGWRAWDLALRGGPPRGTLAAGDALRLGAIRIAVLWPRPGTVSLQPAKDGRGFNDVSIVLLGEADGRHFLLTGDAEEDVDPALIAAGLPHLDVLKVAHHGSATATSAALLAATRPTDALVSVGTGNDYGHPAPSTLARLRQAGARTYRTDLDGRLEADLGPGGVTVQTGGGRGTGTIDPSRTHRPVADRPLPNARPVRVASRANSRTGDRRRRHRLRFADDEPGAPRVRPPPARAGPAAVVPAPRLCRSGRGRLAGGARRRERAGAGPPDGRGGGAPPRRGQAAGGGCPCGPPPRRGIGRLARGPGLCRAGTARPRSPGHSPR
jgi:competence protein ComEC